MAGWKDYIEITGQELNKLNRSQLSRIVSRMGDVANKRLRRLESHDIEYGTYEGEGTISGVRKFGSAGKDINALRKEFVRVRNFLKAEGSTVTGLSEQYHRTMKEVREIGREYRSRKDVKDTEIMHKQVGTRHKRYGEQLYAELRDWRNMWNVYNKIIDQKIWAPTEYDSRQIQRELYRLVQDEGVDEDKLEDREVLKKMYEKANEMYEAQQRKIKESNSGYSGVSSLLP